MFPLPRFRRVRLDRLLVPRLPTASPRLPNVAPRRSTSYYSKSPTSFTPLFSSSPGSRSSSRPLLFAGAFSLTAFVGAALLTNFDTDNREQATDSARWRLGRKTTDADLQRLRRTEEISQAKSVLNELKNTFGGELRAPILLAEGWLNLSEAQRTCSMIIGINLVVFGAWQLRRFQPFMIRRFLHDPLSSRSTTLLTACFSHKSLLHFGFNSLALFSIGAAASEWLSRPSRSAEQGTSLLRSTSRYEFLAFFCVAGVLASTGSHLWSMRVLLPRISRAALTGAVARPVLPSLGASGAIYACLSVTAFAFPSASVSLIFFPFVPIPILTAFWSMVALDCIGVLRGWRMFDHVAHIVGALAGVLYFEYGADIFDDLRAALGFGKEKPESS